VSTAAGPLAGTETVLLVEDEELVRNLVRACLEQNGYSVLAAGSGEEALRSAGRHRGPIDLIVTDLVLPGIQGRDLAKRLGESHSEAKTLFISGYSKDRAVGEADLEPATAFLRKPFTPAELARKVREVLGNSPRGARRGADRMAT
jgi:CheY-like chemotaxis protein